MLWRLGSLSSSRAFCIVTSKSELGGITARLLLGGMQNGWGDDVQKRVAACKHGTSSDR